MEGKDPEPSAAIMDSQSVKTTESSGSRGYDAGKKVNGIKRHILVDTLGLILKVVVHTAEIQDRDGARLCWRKSRSVFRACRRSGPTAGMRAPWWNGFSRPAAGFWRS